MLGKLISGDLFADYEVYHKERMTRSGIALATKKKA